MRRVHRPTEGDHKKPNVLFDNLRKPPRCLCFGVLVLFALRPHDLDTTEKMGRCMFALVPIVTRAHSVELGALNLQKKKTNGWRTPFVTTSA